MAQQKVKQIEDDIWDGPSVHDVHAVQYCYTFPLSAWTLSLSLSMSLPDSFTTHYLLDLYADQLSQILYRIVTVYLFLNFLVFFKYFKVIW